MSSSLMKVILKGVYRSQWPHLQVSLIFIKYIDGLVQERHNFSALAIELGLSCINPCAIFPGHPMILNSCSVWIYYFQALKQFSIKKG